MLHAGGVHDARRRVEAVAVEAGGGLVEGDVVEHLGQGLLVEVAADDRHRVDRGRGRDAQAAERSDQPAPCGVAERQVVDRGGEDVRDLLRDQLLGRGHPDEDRLREAPDRRARLLAQRRVRLVADHELVRVAVQVLDVTREPGVGLDRDRVFARRAVAAGDLRRDPVAVALVLQLAVELRDEQAAVREDQDADRARRLDEAGGCNRLARRGRVPEAVAADGARVGCDRQLVLLDHLAFDHLAVLSAVAVLVLLFLLEVVLRFLDGLGLSLRGCDQLCEHPRERVDLVPAELGARFQVRRALAQHPFEAEHQRVPDLPLGRGSVVPGLDLRDRVVERDAARSAGREDLRDVLVGVEERLPRPLGGARRRGDERTRLHGRGQRLIDGLLHRGSATSRCVFRRGRPRPRNGRREGSIHGIRDAVRRSRSRHGGPGSPARGRERILRSWPTGRGCSSARRVAITTAKPAWATVRTNGSAS